MRTAFVPALAAQAAVQAAVLVVSLAGCRGVTSEDPPIMPERNMYDQERYNPESYSQFFPDHRTMRTPVEGTIARDRYEDDPEVATGLLADKSGYVLAVPPQIIQRSGGMERFVTRGQERFNIYCAVCHARTGEGDGLVVRRGFSRPPSYHIDRLRQAPLGHFFDVMTNGYGAMPRYDAQVSVSDRWAIAAYIRALQLSRNATIDDVPADKRAQLENGGQTK